MKIPPSLLQMPKILLSALVYSLPAGNNSTLQEVSMFPFLVLRAVPIAKWIHPAAAATKMTSVPDLKVHGVLLSQHCWEVLSLTSIDDESSCVRSWRSSNLASP